jgi:hypothetical protein
VADHRPAHLLGDLVGERDSTGAIWTLRAAVSVDSKVFARSSEVDEWSGSGLDGSP